MRSKEAVTELFSTVAEKVGDRPGGYTRIIKLGNRLGDNADMATTSWWISMKFTMQVSLRRNRQEGVEEEAEAPKAEAPAPAAETKTDDSEE